jgi:HD superfamily phosphohydrolase YqeK
MYYAHTPSEHNPEKWHSLIDHSLQVAESCKEIGYKIGFPKTAYTLGILHDSGKIKQDFQKKLVDAFYHNQTYTLFYTHQYLSRHNHIYSNFQKIYRFFYIGIIIFRFCI